MEVNHILPPMAPGTWLITDGYECRWYDECGHQTVCLQSDVQYEKWKLSDALDFNLSAEYVGDFRLQEIIVSAKVRKLFTRHKIHASFFPVAIL